MKITFDRDERSKIKQFFSEDEFKGMKNTWEQTIQKEIATEIQIKKAEMVTPEQRDARIKDELKPIFG